MSSSPILLAHAGPVTTVTLNRPDKRNALNTELLSQLIAAVAAAGSPQLAQLLQQETVIVPAQKAAPKEWKTWWWVCLGGQVIFLGLIFTMRGRWSPRKAREDDEEREALVARELAAIRAAAPEPAGAGT